MIRLSAVSDDHSAMMIIGTARRVGARALVPQWPRPAPGAGAGVRVTVTHWQSRSSGRLRLPQWLGLSDCPGDSDLASERDSQARTVD